MTVTAPPIAYYGGKTKIASKIAALLPSHDHYVEPFAGSLAVLLAKSPSRMETVNDLDGLLMTFWRVLRERPDELARMCALTPHSRADYVAASERDATGVDDLERARLVWLQIAQGYGGTLRSTGWRHYVDPAGSATSMPQYLDAYVDRMAAAAQRLHRVSLENRPGLEMIKVYGQHPRCCLYVDPPYLGSTRSRGGGSYRVDMRDRQSHVQLLWALSNCQASVLVSGYSSPLYEEALQDWCRVEIAATTGQSSTNPARTEVIWSNRPINDQPSLFEDSDDPEPPYRPVP